MPEIAAFREGLPNTADLVCYGVGLVVVLEGARRTDGMILLTVVLAAIGYLLFGEYLPGVLNHRAFWFDEVLEISYSYQGILRYRPRRSGRRRLHLCPPRRRPCA